MRSASPSRTSSVLLALVSLCASPIAACGGDEATEESGAEPLRSASDPAEESTGEESRSGDDPDESADGDSAGGDGPDEGADGDDGEEGPAGGTEPDLDDESDPATDASPEALRVFVTSTRQTAALGGPEGADELCDATARAAALEGTFRAWLSTRDTPVAERLRAFDGPYVRMDGVQIADDWNDLVDGDLQAAISIDESGNAASGDVWTGTLGDGSPLLSDDCGGFTIGDASGRAQCGSSTATSAAWTQNLTPSCSVALRLYCFEQ